VTKQEAEDCGFLVARYETIQYYRIKGTIIIFLLKIIWGGKRRKRSFRM
jgi:hypothetical protein